MFRKLSPEGVTMKSVTISIDDRPMTVEEGQSIAAVLLRIPPFTARVSPVRNIGE